MDRLRSLNLEHVSPSSLMRPEIWRRASDTPKGEEAVLVAMRRWFWTRKPDAGFLLTGFPATLLQALVFDEWLEARSESLTAVLAASGADGSLVDHYRTQGLLDEGSLVSAS